jgi:DUF2939 family protein
MRRLIKVLILVLLPLALAYAAWPIYSALEIREAVIAGDTATLNRKVEWEALRASLKASITPETIARLMADPDAPKPTLWQRIRAVVAPSMAESVIERYVTPEHLPVLLGYRRIYRGTVRPAGSSSARWSSRATIGSSPASASPAAGDSERRPAGCRQRSRTPQSDRFRSQWCGGAAC